MIPSFPDPQITSQIYSLFYFIQDHLSHWITSIKPLTLLALVAYGLVMSLRELMQWHLLKAKVLRFFIRLFPQLNGSNRSIFDSDPWHALKHIELACISLALFSESNYNPILLLLVAPTIGRAFVLGFHTLFDDARYDLTHSHQTFFQWVAGTFVWWSKKLK
jgi:hypothetical protein